MERVGPNPPPSTALGAGRVIPVGKGWVLEPIGAGYLLKALGQGVQVRLTAAEAQAVRQGDITADAMAAQHGLVLPHHTAGTGVAVAFSAEAMRLAGMNKAAGSKTTPPQDETAARGAGIDLPRMAMVGAAMIALLALALIWAA
jgi:hypothetical protein